VTLGEEKKAEFAKWREERGKVEGQVEREFGQAVMRSAGELGGN